MEKNSLEGATQETPVNLKKQHQTCAIHTHEPAYAACSVCGRSYCQHCLFIVNGSILCEQDCQKIYPIAPPSEYPLYPSPQYPSRYGRTATLLLCIFLGWTGTHYFYVGRIGMGLLYLFTFGFLGIGGITDIIRIVTGNFKDEFGCSVVKE